MGAIAAEFFKLKRSLSWVVVVLFPLMVLATAVAGTVFSGKPLEDGWHTLWLRVTVFYGLFPLAVGVAVLASLVWRVEHQGGNWNALMGRPVSILNVMTSKLIAIATLVTATQLVLLAGIVVVGKFVFALPGMLPTRYLLISAVIVIASLPVVALQSTLSMIMRSFAAPLAFTLFGSAIGVVLGQLDVAVLFLPYALLTDATQLGTGAFGDSGTVTLGGCVTIVGVAALSTIALSAGSAAFLNRRDIR